MQIEAAALFCDFKCWKIVQIQQQHIDVFQISTFVKENMSPKQKLDEIGLR